MVKFTGSRLILTFGWPLLLVGVGLIGVGIAAGGYLHYVDRVTSFEVTHNIAMTNAATELMLAVREARRYMNRYAISRDRAELRTVMGLQDDIEAALVAGRSLAMVPAEVETLGQIDAAMKTVFRQLDELLARPKDANFDEAVAVLREKTINGLALAKATELLNLDQERTLVAAHNNEVAAEDMVLGIIVLLICAGVGGVLSGIVIARKISRNLVQLSLPIRTAAGRLDDALGPLTVKAGADFAGLQQLADGLAGQVTEVVDRLQQAQHQALRAERLSAMGQMAAGIAHELRNPLMAMKILVQVASERGEVPLRSRRDLQVLEDEISRMEQLISSFLDFARPPTLKSEACDAAVEVAQTIRFLKPRAERVHVTLHGPAADTPVPLVADAGQLRQLVLNLVLNALDAVTRDGSIWVGVHSEAALHGGDPDDKAVVISVADDGPGLSAELGERIFDPFVSTKDTGIGLGLSICRRIAEAHGGVISACNRAGGGALFTVRIPARRPAFLAPIATSL